MTYGVIPVRSTNRRNTATQANALSAAMTNPSPKSTQGSPRQIVGINEGVDARTDDGRDGQHEREPRGTAPSQPQRQGSGDGDARTRGAGNKRQRLRESDQQGLGVAGQVGAFCAATAIGEPKDDAEDDSRNGDYGGGSQVGLDLGLERHAGDDHGNGRD